MAEALELLARAPSKDALATILDFSFRHRQDPGAARTTMLEASLGVGAAQAVDLLRALVAVVRDALYRSSQVAEPGHLGECFPEGTNAKIQKLLSQLILDRLPLWRRASISQTVSLPRLVDVDWRVDLKTASDAVSNMNVPTTVVALRVEEQPSHRDHVPGVRQVKFELSREALHTMLDGLGRIRDELSSMHRGEQS